MNAESAVVEAIDELLAHDDVDDLVDWQLANYDNRSGYDHDVNQDECPLCLDEWHGLPDEDGWCPGPFATDEEQQAFATRFDEFQRESREHREQREDPEHRDHVHVAVPVDLDRPTVRFWAIGSEDNLLMSTGTLKVDDISVRHDDHITEYTVTGRLFPPIAEHDFANVELPEQVEPPMIPIEGGLISSDIRLSGESGFQPLGLIEPDALDISTDIETRTDWGGRTLATSMKTSIKFSTFMVSPVIERLFTP